MLNNGVRIPAITANKYREKLAWASKKVVFLANIFN
jgi:hypothetical protein